MIISYSTSFYKSIDDKSKPFTNIWNLSYDERVSNIGNFIDIDMGDDRKLKNRALDYDILNSINHLILVAIITNRINY